MGVNTHRLFIIVVLLNTMVHLATAMYYAPELYDTSYLTNEDTIMKEFASDFKEEQGSSTINTNLAFENTYGNPVSMGSIIFKALIKGMNPLPFTSDQFNTWPEKIFITGLNMLKYLFWTIFILEGYMLIKNKKTS